MKQGLHGRITTPRGMSPLGMLTLELEQPRCCPCLLQPRHGKSLFPGPSAQTGTAPLCSEHPSPWRNRNLPHNSRDTLPIGQPQQPACHSHSRFLENQLPQGPRHWICPTQLCRQIRNDNKEAASPALVSCGFLLAAYCSFPPWKWLVGLHHAQPL